MRLGTLIRADLQRSKRRLAVVGVAVAVSVAVVVVLGALVAGIRTHVVEPLLPQLPLDLLKVEERTLSVGLLAFDKGGLDQAAVDRLSRIEGVQEVYPVVAAGFPMRAEGGEGFIGKRLRTDVFATGVEPSLVAADVADGYAFDDEKNGRVPVIVARRLLDLYNSTVASALGKPRLSEAMVIGFEFDLVLGSSYARGTPDATRVRRMTAQIVGLSDQATLVGITVPLQTVKRWNREQRQKDTLSAAYVRTARPEDAGPVTQAIERAGLKVDDTAKIVGAGITIAGALIGLFGGALLLLSAFAIAQTFFLLVGERRTELAILKALGARGRDLSQMIFLEAMTVGAVGGALGLVLGVFGALALNTLVVGSIPDIPFRPTRIVSLPGSLLVGAFAMGVLSSLLGAWLPARRAAGADPASALRT